MGDINTNIREIIAGLTEEEEEDEKEELRGRGRAGGGGGGGGGGGRGACYYIGSCYTIQAVCLRHWQPYIDQK